MKRKKQIKIIKLVIVLVLIITISIILRVNKITTVNEIISIIRDRKEVAALVYIMLFTFLPTFFMPVTVLAIAAGAVFGFLDASFYTFVGAFLNATLTFFISKYFAYDIINDYLDNKYKVEYEKLKKNTKGKNGFILNLILRLLPIAPFTLFNYLCGAAGYDYKIFITSTLLGILPGMFCYVNIGASSIDGLSSRLVASISVLIAFLVLTTFLAKKYYYKK